MLGRRERKRVAKVRRADERCREAPGFRGRRRSDGVDGSRLYTLMGESRRSSVTARRRRSLHASHSSLSATAPINPILCPSSSISLDFDGPAVLSLDIDGSSFESVPTTSSSKLIRLLFIASKHGTPPTCRSGESRGQKAMQMDPDVDLYIEARIAIRAVDIFSVSRSTRFQSGYRWVER